MASAWRGGKHGQQPKCPECKRPMEYCDFAVMLAIDLEYLVQPPLWLCRHCWRVLPARHGGPESVGRRARLARPSLPLPEERRPRDR